eukprot:6143260-Pyramimonas_sp.AAC.1
MAYTLYEQKPQAYRRELQASIWLTLVLPLIVGDALADAAAGAAELGGQLNPPGAPLVKPVGPVLVLVQVQLGHKVTPIDEKPPATTVELKGSADNFEAIETWSLLN